MVYTYSTNYRIVEWGSRIQLSDRLPRTTKCWKAIGQFNVVNFRVVCLSLHIVISSVMSASSRLLSISSQVYCLFLPLSWFIVPLCLFLTPHNSAPAVQCPPLFLVPLPLPPFSVYRSSFHWFSTSFLSFRILSVSNLCSVSSFPPLPEQLLLRVTEVDLHAQEMRSWILRRFTNIQTVYSHIRNNCHASHVYSIRRNRTWFISSHSICLPGSLSVLIYEFLFFLIISITSSSSAYRFVSICFYISISPLYLSVSVCLPLRLCLSFTNVKNAFSV